MTRSSPYNGQRCVPLGIVAALLLVLALPAATNAQPKRWRWSNPEPHGANIYDMTVNQGIAVQAAENGQLFSSDDLAKWIPQPTGVTNHLRGVAFLGERLIVSGQSGLILWGDSFKALNAVQLPTADWLESVAASEDLVVAVGDNGTIYSSSDGTNWTLESAPFATWLRGVATSGNTFVAVGENGLIASRSNNGSWSQETSGVSEHLNRIAFIGQQFWVVGNNGTVLNGNANGKNWNPAAGLSTTNDLFTVAGSEDSVIVAGAGALWRTENDQWIDETAASKPLPAPPWSYYASFWDPPLFFVGGESGLSFEGFATNGADHVWVNRSDSVRIWIWDLIRLPDFHAAVGDHGLIQTSEDGVSWHLEATPMSATNRVLLGIGGNTNGLIIAGNKGALLFSPDTVTNLVFTNVINGTTNIITNIASTIGVDWNAVNSGVTNDLMAVTRFGQRWVVAGAGGTIIYGNDGTNWTSATSPSTSFLSGASPSSAGFVLSGDAGTILTSPDGINWSVGTSGTTNWIFRLAKHDDRIVGVGENGLIITSVDATSWQIIPPITDAWLQDVTHAGDGWYASGTGGTVLFSPNATDWTRLPTPTGKSLYGIAATTNQVVAAGVEGAIIRGIARPSEAPIEIIEFGRVDRRNLLSISGIPDQRFMLESSTNLVDWLPGSTFELSDKSGTLLILEAESTNEPPTEFVRGRLLPEN